MVTYTVHIPIDSKECMLNMYWHVIVESTHPLITKHTYQALFKTRVLYSHSRIVTRTKIRIHTCV